MTRVFRAGLHNSESSQAQIINIICRGPQKSISSRCRDFVVVLKKFQNDNYLLEVKFCNIFYN